MGEFDYPNYRYDDPVWIEEQRVKLAKGFILVKDQLIAANMQKRAAKVQETLRLAEAKGSISTAEVSRNLSVSVLVLGFISESLKTLVI